MTATEALSTNAKSEIQVSYGDTLKSICYKEYRKTSDSYIRAISLLNLRLDIQNLKQGDTVIVVPENILLQIDEL